jgi:hypothetical protein
MHLEGHYWSFEGASRPKTCADLANTGAAPRALGDGVEKVCAAVYRAVQVHAQRGTVSKKSAQVVPTPVQHRPRPVQVSGDGDRFEQ